MSDMADLFSRDPLELTSSSEFAKAYEAQHGKRPIVAIIERYRAARAQFNLGVAQAGSTKKVKAEAGPKQDAKSLDELLND